MGTAIVMQLDHTPHEPAGILSCDGGKKVLEGFAIMLCIDGDVRVLECQQPSAARN
jgi:hypothetical protein